MFHFMVHDKWSNCLFLHWRIPSHLESILEEHTSPFKLDRATATATTLPGNGDDCDNNKQGGSAWIGLILLTEQNVGPSILRSRWTTVTHHGVNVRTYVKGPNSDSDADDVGIHFASLECNDVITSFGADIFGMPYKVAAMERSFEKMVDVACSQNEGGGKSGQLLSLKSVRARRSDPSLINIAWTLLEMLLSIAYNMLFIKQKSDARKEQQGVVQSKKLSITENDPVPNNKSSRPDDKKDDTNYTVEAQWERHPSTPPPDPKLAHFFCERYHVYTQKYGLRWKGTVHHKPWLVEKAVLKGLIIRNIDSYEPKRMRPILQYMAQKEPDSALFSQGVGPIQFEMLRPV
uniref:Uncharacterized protein n=1 Tax=Ditylum brightwellii TaxID=49249 RepID=A0A7S4SSM7_9STRA|mmetsp:Transcript_36422/g.48824  ORF Transcript_36422/g.48824 Transcript_36422/m.48824 type:complete len:347 (+) Transcript_36422:116-1156(+)